MLRLPLQGARARLLVPLVMAFVMLSASAAWAQLETKRPVIDSAPASVALDATAEIAGHLENYQPGDEVALEKRRVGSEFKSIRVKPVNENGKVRFWVEELRRSADYRLSWTDPASNVSEYSDVVTIGVRARLRFWVNPDDVMTGRRARLRGSLVPSLSGRSVVIQQRISGEWRTIDRDAIADDGSFGARFRPRHHGHRRLRVRFRGDARNEPARKGRRLSVYERAPATWYGPGFYGQSTACGKTLKRDTLGVAHRTLPCGTKVAILYKGKTITVPVIDRGPYTSADYDLTSRTARKLDFSGTDTIGVVPGS